MKWIKGIVLVLFAVYCFFFTAFYAVNFITVFKLDWYLLIHPTKWFSFGFLWGFPLWETLALLNITVCFCFLLKEYKVLFEDKYRPIKKLWPTLFFIVILPLATSFTDKAQKFVMKHAFDINTKIYAISGLQDKYNEFMLKNVYGLSDEMINQAIIENFMSYMTREEQQLIKETVTK